MPAARCRFLFRIFCPLRRQGCTDTAVRAHTPVTGELVECHYAVIDVLLTEIEPGGVGHSRTPPGCGFNGGTLPGEGEQKKSNS